MARDLSTLSEVPQWLEECPVGSCHWQHCTDFMLNVRDSSSHLCCSTPAPGRALVSGRLCLPPPAGRGWGIPHLGWQLLRPAPKQAWPLACAWARLSPGWGAVNKLRGIQQAFLAFLQAVLVDHELQIRARVLLVCVNYACQQQTTIFFVFVPPNTT